MKRLLLATLLLLPACAGQETWHTLREGLAPRPTTDRSRIEVLHRIPQRPYEVIADVGTVGSVRDKPEWFDKSLVKEAAKVGADAVLVTSRREGLTWTQGITIHKNWIVEGMAIAWSDSTAQP